MKVLVVVDMQNDFIDGALGTAEAAAIVARVVQRIENSRGELILFTKDTHGADYLDTPEGKKLPVSHCIEGTKGWETAPRILDAWRKNATKVVDETLPENTFTKPVFGCTDLVAYLKARESDIDAIEILGVCTDICVVSNAVMIKNTMPNVPITVNAACCAGVTPQSHNEALNVMKMCQIDVV